MEAFSLLKYWRGGGDGGTGASTAAAAASVSGGVAGAGDGDGDGDGDGAGANLGTTAATVVTAVTHQSAETDDDDDDDDDGPFFDLEFAVQDEAEEEEEEEEEVDNDDKNDEENQNDDADSEEEDVNEFKFTISSNSSGDGGSNNNEPADPNLTLSPSEDLFFKGRLVPIEPSSLVFNSNEPNSRPQFPVSLLKSATKFRVFMLGFKKSKQQNNVSEKTEANNGSVPKQQQKQETEKEKQSKFFTVKFKVEEVPIVSMFTRDNSSSRKSQNPLNLEYSATSDEKKFSKDVMQKYLKKVKPLYIRVSKRYGEKLKFSGQLNLGGTMTNKPVQSPPSTAGQKSNPVKATAENRETETEASENQVKSQKQANIPERLRVVCKHLAKSRSASSAVAAAPAAPVVSRRDDSLLQQQDGIQSAILHCKRSFNASRDSESSLLPRSVSDPSHQKSAIEGKEESFAGC
ncbi:probable membrane-associated kinase regulator 2 [Mangifera indica]|uniref:probable membrane-associated kinase regulator 2 n=1 Tax=Mangifera indica TaxID=29780 RepID=UPI001CFBC1A8|nr:probable membrane-associated kinase regulator 2 [Mangifera indica]